MRRLTLIFALLAVSYAVGFASDVFLNDDGPECIGAVETGSLRYEEHWFPVRTDCYATAPGGAVTFTRGSSEVFWAMFVSALVIGLALMAAVKLAWRMVVIAGAAIAAFLVIFII